MFSKATANFLRQIDPEGSLIHVSRLNDSHKLVPMALVVKRNCSWFWQRPKYQPTDFTLGDLLQGDEVLVPEVSEKDFVTYEGTYGDNLSGRLETEATSVSVTLEGRNSTKLQSSFGKLKIHELNVKKLLTDTGDRHLDMQHKLVKQLRKRAELLAVVKETVFTTSSCSVMQKGSEQCTLQGVLGLMGMLGSSVKVCVKDSNNMEADSDVSLEIPSGTVIAYSILELEIKKDGHYDVCLQPGTIGGIESDTLVPVVPSHDPLDVLDGRCNGKRSLEKVPLSALLNELKKMDLSPLAELPQSTRSALFKGLQKTLKDRTALSHLQCVLEDLCCGETADMVKQEDLAESQRKLVSAVLDLLGVECHIESGECVIPAYLSAAHLLFSAMEELSDETLSLLSESCPDFLEAFDTLMCRFKGSGKLLSTQCPPLLLQDGRAFQQAEVLLTAASVTLRKDIDKLWIETESNIGVHLLVLCVSVHGLSMLSNGPKQ